MIAQVLKRNRVMQRRIRNKLRFGSNRNAFPYGCMLSKGSLHLPKFDAEATYFHLEIGASQIVNVACGIVAGQVARTIDPDSRPKRIG